MGLEYNKRPVFARRGLQVNAASTFAADIVMSAAGVRDATQTLTHADTATTLKSYGVTFITSTSTAGTNIFTLDAPKAGYRKSIIVDVNTTDAVDVAHASSASVFFGTTANALRFSTGAVTPKRAVLVGKSTSVWAVEYLSTGVTVVATTL